MKTRPQQLKVFSGMMLNVYRLETGRMKEMILRGQTCEQTLALLADAFATLLQDEDFVNLLAVEESLQIPKLFLERINSSGSASNGIQPVPK